MPRLRSLQPRPLATLKAKALAAEPVKRKQGSAGVADRERIRKRDAYLCQRCKREGVTRALAHVDHIVPLWEGGSDSDANKEGICLEHHLAKSAEEEARRPRAPTSR